MIRSATIEEIERHLISLGGGNHVDNMKVIRKFPRHYQMSLTETELNELVFLQRSTVSKIVPPNSDRRLKAVAQRARELSPTEATLGSNWDITVLITRFRQFSLSEPKIHLPALVLRDTHGTESDWSPGGWYLQDGSHRALAYCMMILAGEMEYQEQLVFCATFKQLVPCA
jgi:hypothetical protein